ncbi:hypothetical protein HMPREF0578_1389 [Mobiluncus mulieris 28-1]|nr:hypothetical protein HMPREF0577_2075 [Mobiluncus mulieris ATCC 35243]EEZ92060.1 hypothetical protein HMPREF0578_1389 [Mobiluncus mulieris 28-1]
MAPHETAVSRGACRHGDENHAGAQPKTVVSGQKPQARRQQEQQKPGGTQT